MGSGCGRRILVIQHQYNVQFLRFSSKQIINTFDSNVPSVLAGGSNTGPTFNATNNFTTVH